jgi:hypothetical protein
MSDVPDVTDADIRRMVLRNHEPAEMWSVGGKLLSVHCGTCYQRWPCPSRQAAWKAEQQAGREAIARAKRAEPEIPHGEVEWANAGSIWPWRRRC